MNEIYVFGRGEYWKYKSDSIRGTYRVIGYVDNKKSEPSDAEGIPIYYPHETADNKAVQIAVMTSSKFFVEMVQQLIALGVKEQRIILGGNIAPFYDAGERLINQLGGKYTLHDGKLFVFAGNKEYEFSNKEEYRRIIKKLVETTSFYSAVKNMPLVPISRKYGVEFGKPIDRYYIEKFLEINRQYIHGDVIEIEDTTYTLKYGQDLRKYAALHVEDRDGCIRGNLETGEGIDDGMADCLICTQTLQYIYHMENAAKNIWKMLKTGGTALITMPFLCQYFEGARSWNDYWRATPQCLKKVLAEVFGEENVAAGSLGNIKTAVGFMYGICCEDMNESDFGYNDKEYPVTVWAICHRE